MQERRQHSRREVRAKVRIEHELFGTIQASTVDISDGGVFIGLDVSPPVSIGDHIRLSFLDSAQPDVIFNSTLVRITDKGWGLNFQDYEVDGVRRKIEDLREEYRSKQQQAR